MPVVRQPHRDVRPAYVAPPAAVGHGLDMLGECAVLAREALELLGIDGMEAAGRLRGTLAQRERDQAAGLQHVDQLAERACTLARSDVHPNGGEQDHVERGAEASDAGERGQAVVDPADARMRVPALGLLAHRARRLDSDHLEALLREPRRIAARACADVERERAFRGRQQR